MTLLHQNQKPIASSQARFIVERCGRRFGKTLLKIERMLFKSISKNVTLARVIVNRSVIFIAPTQKQARTIVWEELKRRLHGIGDFNESRLEIKIPNEEGGTSTLFVGGWENRENYRGMPNVTHIEFDEVDTMKDFFIGWQEIFRPMLIDTGGSAGFGGTPKRENPNLRRLEKVAENDVEWGCFHNTTADNPFVPASEIEKARNEMDAITFQQEIMAEYVDNSFALFKFNALVDTFSNAIVKTNQKYLIIDVADDGSDKTKFSFWEGMEEYRRETFEYLNTEAIISQIREYQTQDKIPMSNTCVDAIGVGSAVASNSTLSGIIGYKSSYAPIRTDASPVVLPYIHYTKDAPLTSEYSNLRSQCVFELARNVNDHKIASKVTGRNKEAIIEELSLYQDSSKGDGKRMATQKDDVKAILGHSPDDSDVWIMRMYFAIRDKMLPNQTEQMAKMTIELEKQFTKNAERQNMNSSR